MTDDDYFVTRTGFPWLAYRAICLDLFLLNSPFLFFYFFVFIFYFWGAVNGRSDGQS